MVANVRRVTIAIFVLWLVLFLVVLPSLVRDAYAGTGIGFLNQMFESRRSNSLDHYMTSLRILAAVGGIGILGAGFGLIAAIRDAARGSPVARRFVLPAAPTSLAGIRIAVVGVALVIALLEDPSSTALLPRWSEAPYGLGLVKIVRRVPGIEALLSSAGALMALKLFTVGALVLALVGLFTRFALVAAVAGGLVLGAVLRMYTHFFHTGLLPLYLLVVLCFCRCADAWSIDAVLRRRAGKPVPPPERPSMEYGWGRFVCWSVVALTYFAAGTSKLRHGGFLWWDGVNLKSKLLADVLQVNSIELPWTPLIGELPVAVFSILGLGTLIIEAGFPAVLFSRTARFLFPLGAAGLHLGVFLMQEILFLDLMLIQILFFDVRKPAAYLEQRFRSRFPALALAGPSDSTSAGPEEQRAETGALAPVPLGTLLLAVFPVVYCGTIALGLEAYPITTWSMYSDRTQSTRVQYILFHGLDAAGRKVPVRFEDAFGVLHFNRAYDIVPRAFHDEDGQRPLRQMLDAFAGIRDRERSAGERLSAFQFDLRAWDYARDPGDPNRGVTVSTFVHRIGSAASAEKP
ncbi:MAG TPA: hypothetical protein VFZ53_06770 [Polyangiaceae bacterium]